MRIMSGPVALCHPIPPVMIDGEHYWDGGVVSNTPITYVSDERPLTTCVYRKPHPHLIG